MGKLDVDDSEIKSITGISISEVSGNFSNEWLSCTFIDNVIKEINDLISSFNQVKGEANNYTDTNEEISNQPEPTIPHSGGGSGHGSSSNGSDAKFFTTGLVNNYSNLIIKNVPKGSKVVILEVDDGSGWIKVKLEDGTEGYIQKNYIQIENGTYNGLIIETTNILSSKPSGLYNAFSNTTNNTVLTTSKKGSFDTATFSRKISSQEGEETL